MSANFNPEDVEDLTKVLDSKVSEFLAEAKKFINKSAARRARKLSLELRDLMKKFRAISIK